MYAIRVVGTLSDLLALYPGVLLIRLRGQRSSAGVIARAAPARRKAGKAYTPQQTGQEMEDAPGSVGMGNMVKASGQDRTVNSTPNGGNRKTMRRMPNKERGSMECKGNGLGV